MFLIKEKHNLWFERKAWERLVLLHKKSGKSMSVIANKAILEYKRTEIENYTELMKETARKIDSLQKYMIVLEQAKKASVDNSNV